MFNPETKKFSAHVTFSLQIHTHQVLIHTIPLFLEGILLLFLTFGYLLYDNYMIDISRHLVYVLL